MKWSVPFPLGALGFTSRALTVEVVRSAAETGRNAPTPAGTPALCPSATLSSPSRSAAVETPRIATPVSARTSYAPRAGVASQPFGAIRAHALPGTSQTAMSSRHTASNPLKLISAFLTFIQTLSFFSYPNTTTILFSSVSLFEISAPLHHPPQRAATHHPRLQDKRESSLVCFTAGNPFSP